MNLRQLANFLKIAELRSISRAATVLRVAQPALSRQIQQLEQEFGADLLQRTDRGVILTEAGRALCERARSILQQIEGLRDAVTEHSDTPRGEFSVGAPPSMHEMVTLPLIAEYHARYPHVLVRLIEETSAALHELVMGGRVDAAMIADIEPLGILDAAPLIREQLYLVGPKQARLKLSRAVPLEEVARHPLILTSRPNALRTLIDRAMERSGIAIRPSLEVNTTQMTLDMVIAGLGYGVMPYCAIYRRIAERTISVSPIDGLSVAWTFVHSRERALSLAGRKFRELLFDVIARRRAAGDWPGAIDSRAQA